MTLLERAAEAACSVGKEAPRAALNWRSYSDKLCRATVQCSIADSAQKQLNWVGALDLFSHMSLDQQRISAKPEKRVSNGRMSMLLLPAYRDTQIIVRNVLYSQPLKTSPRSRRFILSVNDECSIPV